MTVNELIEKGYKIYAPSAFSDDCITDIYQKSFSDEDDKRKYFLTWNQWDFSRYASHDESFNNPIFEGGAQLMTHDENTIEFKFFSGWDIEKAEQMLEKIYQLGDFRKYDDVHGGEE